MTIEITEAPRLWHRQTKKPIAKKTKAKSKTYVLLMPMSTLKNSIAEKPNNPKKPARNI